MHGSPSKPMLGFQRDPCMGFGQSPQWGNINPLHKSPDEALISGIKHPNGIGTEVLATLTPFRPEQGFAP